MDGVAGAVFRDNGRSPDYPVRVYERALYVCRKQQKLDMSIQYKQTLHSTDNIGVQ